MFCKVKVYKILKILWQIVANLETSLINDMILDTMESVQKTDTVFDSYSIYFLGLRKVNIFSMTRLLFVTEWKHLMKHIKLP